MGVWFGAAVKPLSDVCSLAGVVCCATEVQYKCAGEGRVSRAREGGGVRVCGPAVGWC